MSKNIVVCCDGTGNEFGADDNTNVIKLFSTLLINDSQAGYYHPGVGAMGEPGGRGWFGEKWSQLKGLAFGAGLLDNVADAYRYLMDTYVDGDVVFVFGFSRGSYTARAVAGLLHMYGLLRPGNEGLIPYIIRMYASKTLEANFLKHTLIPAEDFKATFSRECPVHFEGLWDTVSSVGWITSPLTLLFTARNPSMHISRHAVSIHERRCFYRQNLWGEPFPDQDIKQVWFTGVHSDIGGSYPESQSGLSKVTLEWMLHEAETAGLKIDPCKAAVVLGKAKPPETWMPHYVRPDGNAQQHVSLRSWWWLLEFLPHRTMELRSGSWVARCKIPLGAPRHIPEGSTIYELAKPHVTWNPSYKVEPAVTFPPPGATTGC
jgi:uncharacterized protein (DUF2235 family)